VSAAGTEPLAARSVLRRYLDATSLPVAAGGAAGAPSSTAGSGWRVRAAASTFSSRIAALYHGHAAPAHASQRSVRILPLLSAPTAPTKPQRGERHVVVAPPFAVVVAADGAPDPAFAVLDIAHSVARSTIAGGCGGALVVLDAAVAADKLILAIPSWILMCGPVATDASLQGLVATLRRFA
jgi:hypothetical protein